MTLTRQLDSATLRNYDKSYDTSREDKAFRARGDFLRAFPKDKLKDLTIDEYVIGHHRPTFCNYVEGLTRAWANILGSTSFKFGIYYGRTKTDPTVTYRFASRFGTTKEAAFQSVKNALLTLVAEGGKQNPDFAAIDDNPLAQTIKAKILSLYYPERFLNICSAEHLEELGADLGLGRDLYVSEYQHELLRLKETHSVTKSWGNPKFMNFLYDTRIRADKEPAETLQKPKQKKHRRVNFEDVQDERNAIGKAAEEFALAWETERLSGAGLDELIPMIEDRRDRPGYGYDFLSHTSKRKPRYIEVKSVGKQAGGNGYRFFLSDNEHLVSTSPDHRRDYYFYLVFFNGDGEPADLLPLLASDLYQKAGMSPASYVIRFDFGHTKT